MQSRFRFLASLLLPVCLVGVLSACGGGNDHGDGLTDLQREDRAASASSNGLIGFALAQIGGATSDSSEPRSIAGITPPADDVNEPLPL